MCISEQPQKYRTDFKNNAVKMTVTDFDLMIDRNYL